MNQGKWGARKSKGALTTKVIVKENEFRVDCHGLLRDIYNSLDHRQNISLKITENVKGCSQLKTV